MTKEDILKAIGKLSQEDQDALFEMLRLRRENDEGFKRLDAKLRR